MAATGLTTNYNLSYPLSTDLIALHSDIQALATDVDSTLLTKLNLSGGTLTGNLTVSKASPSILASGSGTAQLRATSSSGYAQLVLDRPAGQYGSMFITTGGSTRWLVGASSDAESGSNAGSNFIIRRYDDTGASIGTSLALLRDSGTVRIGVPGAGAGIELGSSGPRMMSGTGSPESVVSAPVGSVWIQTDSTVGVTHWRKATGSSTTGWVVMEGDTGWRNVSANILTANGFTGGNIQLRRVGNTVTLTAWALTRASAGGGFFYTLPTGFRSPLAYVRTYSNNPAYASNADAYISMGGTSEAGLHMVWITSDAWPTSLPGS